MSIYLPIKNRIQALKKDYEKLRKGKSSLLSMLDEAEIPESVYNSNAIESSTLTLKETEKILLEMEVERDLNLREVFEAKNLAQVSNYIGEKAKKIELNQKLILLLHRFLIGGINDKIAGRLRKKGEYVRVKSYIAPAPDRVKKILSDALIEYASNERDYFLNKISRFHLEFETIHPFCDGNGRIGRALINFQLIRRGFPPVIIRNKEKQDYYNCFNEYRTSGKTRQLDGILAKALSESLHKRNTYLRGLKIITLSNFVKGNKLKAPAIFNAARRQNIPAFREKNVWKIGEGFVYRPRKNK